MKVICVDSKPNPIAGSCKPPFKEGQELEVRGDLNDNTVYWVVGYEICTCGQPGTWFKKRFVPLSEIDETEMSRNYNKELV